MYEQAHDQNHSATTGLMGESIPSLDHRLLSSYRNDQSEGVGWSWPCQRTAADVSLSESQRLTGSLEANDSDGMDSPHPLDHRDLGGCLCLDEVRDQVDHD